MAMISCTIWALMLNTAGIYVFQTCLMDPIEDDGEMPVNVPSIPTFLFSAGVYVILVQIPLLPKSFKKPIAPVLCLYELFSSLFILEFALSCIWDPLNILILSKLLKMIHNLTICPLMGVLNEDNNNEVSMWFDKHGHTIMIIIIYVLSLVFFITALHVSSALDFSIFINHGIVIFFYCAISRLWQRLLSELGISNRRVAMNTLPECSALNRKNRLNNCRRRKPFRECECSN